MEPRIRIITPGVSDLERAFAFTEQLERARAPQRTHRDQTETRAELQLARRHTPCP